MTDAMIYAERTGHDQFEESSEAVPELTPEEKAERIKKVKELIKRKAQEKEEQAKKDELDRERRRRLEGQNMSKIRDEHEAIQRKRDMELREAEKARYKAEQERLRLEVARDKAERAMEKAQRLGLGDPKKAYDEAYAKALRGGADGSLETKVEAVLKVIETARANNRGLECVRTLIKMLGNVVNNPAEQKFRRVNLSNEAFKNRVGGVAGGTAALKLAGFKDASGADAGSFLELPMDADIDDVKKVMEVLQAAEKSSRW